MAFSYYKDWRSQQLRNSKALAEDYKAKRMRARQSDQLEIAKNLSALLGKGYIIKDEIYKGEKCKVVYGLGTTYVCINKLKFRFCLCLEPLWIASE